MPDIFEAKKIKVEMIKPEDIPDERLVEKKPHPPGIFAALVRNPWGMTFANQEKDEHILVFTRRHFFTNFLWIIITVVALFIPLIFSLLLELINIQLPSLSIAFTIVLLLFYYLIVFGYAFYNYVDWFYNIGIITQKRMIDIDFLHLTHIDVAITQLSEIEDVVYKQKGFFASFFDYGDVVAHTVATFKGKEDFVFESIPRPTEVVDLISELLGDKGND